MPQVRIEYSGNLEDGFDARRFALRVHDHLMSVAGADLASCKTRLIRLDDVVIADGSDGQGLIHVDLRILSGRTDEQKRELGAAVMRSLQQEFAKPGGLEVQLTVEVRDMDRDFYHKVRLAG